MGCMQSAESWFAMMASWKGETGMPVVDMDSAPMAMPQSMLPVEIWLAMSWTAFRPEEQKRLTLLAPAVLGMPAARAAARMM